MSPVDIALAGIGLAALLVIGIHAKWIAPKQRLKQASAERRIMCHAALVFLKEGDRTQTRRWVWAMIKARQPGIASFPEWDQVGGLPPDLE